MHAIAGNWKIRLYWIVLVAFCLGLLAALSALVDKQSWIVVAFLVLFVCGIGATIDRLVGPERGERRATSTETSPRSWLRQELDVSISTLEAQRMVLALETAGDPLEIIRGCAWMKWLTTEHEKRSALSHYVALISGARTPFGTPKKTRTYEHSVRRAQRYLELPEAGPRDLVIEFLQRGTRLQLSSTEPDARERAEREATEMCLEYRSFMGWR